MHVVAPEAVGLSAARLARLEAKMRSYIDDGKLAGLITTIARCGRTVHFGTYGMMDREAGKPMAPDAIFRIASMTKPITSVAAMLLYEEGAFDLNTPIADFVPAFKKVKVLTGMTPDGPELEDLQCPIIFRHLFTHTAGLSYGSDPDDPVDQIYQASKTRSYAAGDAPPLATFVQGLAEAPLAFQPGTGWRYSLGIDVLGHLVEVISGMSLDVFFRQRIFEPLGMVDTDFHVPEAKLDRLVTLYGRPNGESALKRLDAPNWAPSRTPPTFLMGGGGLASTVPDYARFAQMLVNGGELDGVRLLSPTTVAMYRINQAPVAALASFDGHERGYGYSLGTSVLMDVAKSGMAGSVGEFGWGGAFSTYFWIDPQEALYGILMTQHLPSNYYPINARFKQLTYQALVG
jgi:CubicO group peptidase (beta-lactamase class C family)